MKGGLTLPTPNSKFRSVSLDRGLADFIDKTIKEHKINRMKKGKDVTIISVLREALFLWFEQEGLSAEAEKYLEQKK